MKTLKTLSILLIATIFMSCEKVIDVELNDADRKIVVEAFTSNIEGRNYIKLSKTSNVYTQNTFDKISDADVTITNKNGTVYTFTEDSGEAGKYILPGFKVEENQDYTLKVVAEGQEITAQSSSSFVPQLNLVETIKGSTFSQNPNDTTRFIGYQFDDPISTGDNYRFILTVNGERDETYYFGNDLLGNGQPYEGIFFATILDSGDVVNIELFTMDNANYDYYYSLVNNTSTGPFAASPANPISNMSGDALGYFGAYLMDTTTIIVQ